jgi:hypothetical protein
MGKSGRKQKYIKTVLYKSFLDRKGCWECHIIISISENSCEAQDRIQQRDSIIYKVPKQGIYVVTIGF